MSDNKKTQARGGFKYYRTHEQLREYMAVPAEIKLRWIEEMWRFNQLLGQSNPRIAAIQEMFRRGEIGARAEGEE